MTAETNTRINTLIMRGLTAADAAAQASREAAGAETDRPVWVRTCGHPGCVLTTRHGHGMTDGQFAAFADGA